MIIESIKEIQINEDYEYRMCSPYDWRKVKILGIYDLYIGFIVHGASEPVWRHLSDLELRKIKTEDDINKEKAYDMYTNGLHKDCMAIGFTDWCLMHDNHGWSKCTQLNLVKAGYGKL